MSHHRLTPPCEVGGGVWLRSERGWLEAYSLPRVEMLAVQRLPEMSAWDSLPKWGVVGRVVAQGPDGITVEASW